MPVESSEIAYHQLPQFTPEQRGDLAIAISPLYGIQELAGLKERIAEGGPSDSVVQLGDTTDRVRAILSPWSNADLLSFVNSVSDETGLPILTVEGMLAQLYAGEVGLPKEFFGEGAHVIALRGNEYGNNPSSRELLGINPHTAVITKIVGGPEFRKNLGLYYDWANTVAEAGPKLTDDELMEQPLTYRTDRTAGQVYKEWIHHSASLGAYTTDEANAKLAYAASEMRRVVKVYNNNQGRVMGSEWGRDARQLIQNEAYDQYTGYMEEVVAPLVRRGTNVFLVVSNFEGLEAGEDHKFKNVTLDVWANTRGANGKNPATVRFDPQKEAGRHGVLMLNHNMFLSTPDGKLQIAAVPFFSLIKDADPARIAGQLASWQKQMQEARNNGRHTLLLLATHPYLAKSEAWRDISDPKQLTAPQWSQITGSKTARPLVKLGAELVQFAVTPDSRRGYKKEPIDPNAYWVADSETTDLRRAGENLQPTDSFVLHSPERTTAASVLYDGSPMALRGSRTLPPRILTNVQK